MATTLHRIKVPVTDEQIALVDALHDPSTLEGTIARCLMGDVPASDSALLAVLVTRGLAEIARETRRARLDAAYEDLAEALANEPDEQAVDRDLSMAAYTYAIGADDTE